MHVYTHTHTHTQRPGLWSGSPKNVACINSLWSNWRLRTDPEQEKKKKPAKNPLVSQDTKLRLPQNRDREREKQKQRVSFKSICTETCVNENIRYDKIIWKLKGQQVWPLNNIPFLFFFFFFCLKDNRSSFAVIPSKAFSFWKCREY